MGWCRLRLRDDTQHRHNRQLNRRRFLPHQHLLNIFEITFNRRLLCRIYFA